MDRFRAQNYKIIERYASLILYFLYLELIFVPLQQNEKDSVSGFSSPCHAAGFSIKTAGASASA